MNVFKRLKHAVECHVFHTHYYFLGKQEELPKWKEEMQKKIKKDGYADCFCEYCGCKLIRIVANPDEEGE